MSKKISVYEIVTEEILKLLDQGTVPWRQSWVGGVPQNYITKRPYTGMNAMMLAIQGYASPYWLTMKQCNDKGGKVKKGEKSSIVVFWKKIDKETKKETDDNDRENVIFVLRYYRVFNVLQCEGIEVEDAPAGAISPLDQCEKVVDGYKGCPPILWNGDRAAYSPKDDEVYMPERSRFSSSEEVYAVLFHELAHSTGHEKRLNRQGSDVKRVFGSYDYSFEELVAEFSSAFLCGSTGISPATIENSAAYIDHWQKALKNDSKLVIQAAGKAQKAADYILGTYTPAK